MDHPIVYVEMSKLCRYEMNVSNIEIKSDFRTFLANRDDRTWTDDKNRTWKYYVAMKNSRQRYQLHPFLVDYERDTYSRLVDLYVYYSVCVYLGAQFDIPEITTHAKYVSEFIKGRVTFEETKREIIKNQDIVALINLFVDNTDILVCYNAANSSRGHEIASKDIVVPEANINVYNPRINVIDDSNGDDRFMEDAYVESGDEDNTVDVNLFDNNDNNDEYEFHFVDDLDDVDEMFNENNTNKSFYVATSFSIKSGTEIMTNVNFPHSDSYRRDRHAVSLLLTIGEATSSSFDDMLIVAGNKPAAVYVCPNASTLYDNLTQTLARLHCDLVVENISFKKVNECPVIIIVFDDIRSKPYKGKNVLDIIIEITFGVKEF